MTQLEIKAILLKHSSTCTLYIYTHTLPPPTLIHKLPSHTKLAHTQKHAHTQHTTHNTHTHITHTHTHITHTQNTPHTHTILLDCIIPGWQGRVMLDYVDALGQQGDRGTAPLISRVVKIFLC